MVVGRLAAMVLTGLVVLALAACDDDDDGSTSAESTRTTVPGISKGDDVSGASDDEGPGAPGDPPSSGGGSTGEDAYTYTFDGAPGSPQSMYWMEGFDVQVHTREMHKTPDTVQFMNAGHGADCSAPPGTHSLTMAEMTVYQCRDHVMTALRADDYGLIYLTPDRLLDWSEGPATLTVDVSTLKTSTRDWWDIWLTEWDTNMALPFNNGDVDLQGEPLGQFLTVHNNLSEGEAFGFESTDMRGRAPSVLWQAGSAAQRDTYVLTIDRERFSFCKPDEHLCWFEDERHGLTMTRAVVQLGHHSYTPRKDDSGIENTWHWDNLVLGPSVPFTMIRANERYVLDSGTITFDRPAPANAYLRFGAIGSVRIDGEPAQRQDGQDQGDERHFSSYWHPIPEGTTSVRYEGGPDDGFDDEPMIKDISIWGP